VGHPAMAENLHACIDAGTLRGFGEMVPGCTEPIRLKRKDNQKAEGEGNTPRGLQNQPEVAIVYFPGPWEKNIR